MGFVHVEREKHSSQVINHQEYMLEKCSHAMRMKTQALFAIRMKQRKKLHQYRE